MMSERVLTIIPSLYDGGAEKFTADLSFGLSKKYQITTLIYNTTETTYPFEGTLNNIKVPETKGFLRKIKRQIVIKNEVKKYKAQMLPKLSISHMLMANMLNIITRKDEKIICVLHGEWSIKTGKSKILDFLVKHFYKKADLIISVSNFIKHSFDDYYKLSVPHKVIYAGIDIAAIERKAEAEILYNLPDNYIVYIAGFRPVKNHIKLLNQLESYLKEEGINLVLLGDGPLRNDIEKEISSLELHRHVMVLGNLSNPYPVIKNAKISVLYSSSESFSLAVVESMALGVPVVATDCGGPREILMANYKENIKLPFLNDFGVLIKKPEDSNENQVSLEIDFLLKNKAIWNNISKNGKIRSKEFSIEKATEAYNSLISTLISS